ncbi:MAG TPA: hypothetical protein V6C82_06155 [Chroococcales cyanobacterium]|jgi:hypothetical protein
MEKKKEITGYQAYDFTIASLGTVVILAVSLLSGARHGLKAGFLCFGACLLLSSLWVFLMGMIAVILDRALLRSEKISRVSLGILSLLKNFGLVCGPILLSGLLFP